MKHRQQGFVLIVVLWVLAIMTVVAVGFGHRAQLNRRAAAYALDHTQALMMARGAVQRGIQELRNKAFDDAMHRMMDPNYVTSINLGQAWAQRKDVIAAEEGLFTLGEEFKNDHVYYQIEDMSARININATHLRERSNDDELLKNTGWLNLNTRKKIRARITGEDQEDGPVPFQAVEEIRYFDSIDDEAWYGADKKPGLRELLTTYGSGMININTASEAVMNCIPGLTPENVEEIIKFRAGGDGELGTNDDQGFRDVVDLTSRLRLKGDPRAAIHKYCTFGSAYFKITGVATRRGGTVRAAASAVAIIDGNDATVVNWQEDTLGS